MLHITPNSITEHRMVVMGFGTFAKLPYKNMSYTFLTLAQTSVALPFALNKVEDFFRSVALGQKTDDERRDYDDRLKEC